MVRPVMVAVRFPLDHVAVAPPGLAVTVYPVITDPPSEDGAVQVTVACVLPAVAETLVGTPGTVERAPGVTALEDEDALPSPTLLVAVTTNV